MIFFNVPSNEQKVWGQSAPAQIIGKYGNTRPPLKIWFCCPRHFSPNRLLFYLFTKKISVGVIVSKFVYDYLFLFWLIDKTLNYLDELIFHFDYFSLTECLESFKKSYLILIFLIVHWQLIKRWCILDLCKTMVLSIQDLCISFLFFLLDFRLCYKMFELKTIELFHYWS